MTDDQTGSRPPDPSQRPELPVPGPPQIPLPVTPPPPGTPPPGALKRTGADGWRWYYALLAFFGGLFVSQVVVLMLGAIWSARTGRPLENLQDDSTFVVVASAINELVFIAAAVVVARMSGPVSARDFGLVRARFAPAAMRTAAIYGGYLVLLVIYSALVHLSPDDSPDRLGASGGAARMLAFALLVAVLAPIAEEIFFRGMVYRSLRNGAGVLPAALISGVFFGALHIDAGTTERLLQVVPLAVFGVMLALLYEWSGTLYASIAAHATNNSIAVVAYASKHDSDFGMILAGVLWLTMMLACTFGHRLTDRSGGPGGGGLDRPDGITERYPLAR